MPISDGYGEMIIGNFPFWRNGIFRWKCLSLILWADMTMVNTIHKLTDVTANSSHQSYIDTGTPSKYRQL